MKRFRWRLRPLVVIASVSVVAVGLLVTYISTERFLRSRLGAGLPQPRVPAFLDEFGNAFLAFSAIAIVFAALASLVLGSAAIRALARMRSDAASRARGLKQPPYRPPVVEVHTLAAAIDRLASDLDARAETLRRERDELALLVGSVSEGILLIGPAARIIHANPAARTLLGLPDACRGQPLPALVRSAELRNVTDRVTATGEAVTSEIGIADRRLLVIGRPISTADGATEPEGEGPGAVVAIVDLTELRRLEGVRRDFVANVSHELKTPLTSIRGYVETLLSDDLDPSMRVQFLEVIQKNAERLHSIVDDLLDLSRIESGGWHPRLTEVSTADAVHEAWDACADRARDKAIAFAPPRLDAHVVADESALRQVLANLFDNAIRHTADGGAIRVDVLPDAGRGPSAGAANGARPEHDDRQLVTIEVRDTGSGIPGDALPRIFERFYRVDPARSRAEGGTGLGLSIVKHLVESMDGEVSAESELGKGTTIRVRLPAPAAPVAM
jgi:two-component system phosphate regulon sensor histidine kinase PhoR